MISQYPLKVPCPILPSLWPLLRRIRRGRRVGIAAPVVPPRLLGLALDLPAFRPGFLIAGYARLLRGSGSGSVVAPLAAPLHALRLRGRRRDASEHRDDSKDGNASPKTPPSWHAILLRCSDPCYMTVDEGEEQSPEQFPNTFLSYGRLWQLVELRFRLLAAISILEAASTFH
jgi:hypothetical protein